MSFGLLTGLYVAVVCSAQIGANKIVRLPVVHMRAPGGVYSIGIALALVQLAHYSAPTRRQGATNAQLSAASAPLDSLVFLTLAFGASGLHYFDGQLVGKIASSVLIGIPLVLSARRLLG